MGSIALRGSSHGKQAGFGGFGGGATRGTSATCLSWRGDGGALAAGASDGRVVWIDPRMLSSSLSAEASAGAGALLYATAAHVGAEGGGHRVALAARGGPGRDGEDGARGGRGRRRRRSLSKRRRRSRRRRRRRPRRQRSGRGSNAATDAETEGGAATRGASPEREDARGGRRGGAAGHGRGHGRGRGSGSGSGSRRRVDRARADAAARERRRESAARAPWAPLMKRATKSAIRREASR